ncbi:MAG: hypothetical protein OXB88_03200 [Bacteriovoracales bacterium]|nr:hypothetical protein [Bacteriovoracales bacterium]
MKYLHDRNMKKRILRPSFVIGSKSHGLTIIEILISISILAFIMVSVIAVTNKSIDNKDLIVKEDRELLQIETALDRLNWDFSQIYTPLYHTREFKVDQKKARESRRKRDNLLKNPLYRGEGRFKGPDFFGRPIPIITQDGKDAIEFYTKAHRRRFENIRESEFAWVRYEFRSYQGDDETKKDLFEFVRYYTSTNVYNSDFNFQDLKPMVLMNNVLSYTFLFWDDRAKKWEESLSLLRGRGEKSLLRGLKLEIKWKRSVDQVEEFSSRTFRTMWPYFKPENLNKIKYKN